MDMRENLIDTSMSMGDDDEASDDEGGSEEDSTDSFGTLMNHMGALEVMERGGRSVTRRSTATPHGVEKWDFQSTCAVRAVRCYAMLCCAVLCLAST